MIDLRQQKKTPNNWDWCQVAAAIFVVCWGMAVTQLPSCCKCWAAGAAETTQAEPAVWSFVLEVKEHHPIDLFLFIEMSFCRSMHSRFHLNVDSEAPDCLYRACVCERRDGGGTDRAWLNLCLCEASSCCSTLTVDVMLYFRVWFLRQVEDVWERDALIQWPSYLWALKIIMHKHRRRCQVNYCISLSVDCLLGQASTRACTGVKTISIMNWWLQFLLHALAEALIKGLVIGKGKQESSMASKRAWL